MWFVQTVIKLDVVSSRYVPKYFPMGGGEFQTCDYLEILKILVV